MANWQVVAEGTTFGSLDMVVQDMQLPKGARVRVVMDTIPGTSWVFDLAGMENVFKPFAPDGMEVIDVWGEGNQGFVEMEADPPMLFAMVAGLPIWAWLVIGGVGGLAILATIITFIVVMIKVPGAAGYPVAFIAGAAGAVLLLVYLASRGPPK